MNKIVLRLVSFAMLVGACSSDQTHTQTAKAKISEILQADREAHLTKDAATLVGIFSDSLIEVNKGRISVIDSTSGHARFQSYFDKVNFITWEDEQPPMIRLSDDSSMAYAVVKKLVVLELKSKPGSLDTTHFAWTAIYRKQGNDYMLDCITSTSRD